MDGDRKEWPLFHWGSYDTAQAKPKEEKDDPPIVRRKRKYESEGMRRMVRAVLLVHVKGHPHVLALKHGAGSRSAPPGYSLPGGTLRPGEAERDGLNRKMKQFIFSPDASTDCKWKIGDLLSMWWSPSFEDLSYPYLPQHVTRPKACIKIYQVALPERCVFAVPPRASLVAIPFFDLFSGDQSSRDGEKQGGPMISDVPQLVSKYALALYDREGEVA